MGKIYISGQNMNFNFNIHPCIYLIFTHALILNVYVSKNKIVITSIEETGCYRVLFEATELTQKIPLGVKVCEKKKKSNSKNNSSSGDRFRVFIINCRQYICQRLFNKPLKWDKPCFQFHSQSQVLLI